MSPVDLAIAAVVLVAAVTQGVIGFGFALVAMAALPRLLPLPSAVAFVALCGALVSALVLLRYRRHVAWREVAPMLWGAALGLPLGVWLLRDADPEPVTRVLGGVLVLYAANALWAARRSTTRHKPLATSWGYPAGFAAGVLGGAFAAGGPPVVAYASARRWPPMAFKGALQGFFTTVSLAHLGLLAYASILTVAIVERTLVFLSLVPIGVWLGMRYGDRMHPQVFRKLVLVALLLLGLTYLVLGR